MKIDSKKYKEVDERFRFKMNEAINELNQYPELALPIFTIAIEQALEPTAKANGKTVSELFRAMAKVIEERSL